MQHKRKKTKKQIRIQDLKPRKDAKGGMSKGSAQDDLNRILKHLELGQGPGGGGKTGPLGPSGHMPQGPPN